MAARLIADMRRVYDTIAKVILQPEKGDTAPLYTLK